MPQMPTEHLAEEWQALLEAAPAALDSLHALAEQDAGELASAFYGEMLGDPRAAPFLDHEQVRQSLHGSMTRWIRQLFAARDREQVDELIAVQRHVGQVHARIDIPVSVVLRGARALKSGLALRLEHAVPDPQLRRAATELGAALVDLAIETMCYAFSQSHERNARAGEAYRLLAVSHNIGAEKERQRAALLDWENQVMFGLASGDTAEGLQPLATSEFGLWFRHKAAHAFQGSPETHSVLQLIEAVDRELPVLGGRTNGPEALPLLRQLREQTRSIKFLLDSLFEQAGDLEAGRDVLTRLLNRKFLPVVLGKEIRYSRQSGHPFTVLILDLDHFKSINDTHGHEVGDLVLQHFATLLTGNTRGGDYAFRLGGEEFVLILVDVGADKALKTAEKLRLMVEREPFHLPQGGELHLTMSVGIAVHDGHPDYQRLLRRADEALYAAKNGGRNRCEVAA